MVQIDMSDTPFASVLMSDEIIYQGKVFLARAHDHHGIVIYPDGSFYEGNIKKGVIEGQGVYRFPDDSFQYSGTWKNGLPNGYGVEVGPTGTYEGSFRQGKK